MFFPVNNYKVIDVPTTNSGGLLIYTTTADSLCWFMPIGSRMEDDTAAFVRASNVFVDTDGGPCDIYLWWSLGGTSTRLNANDPSVIQGSSNSGGGNVSFSFQGAAHQAVSFIPAGINIFAGVGDSSDRIGGTLYVMELPPK